jgi:hypothetical protein
MHREHPLAPMTMDLRVVTGLLLVLPLGFLGAGAVGPAPASILLVGTAAVLMASYLALWLLARPTRFEVDATSLRLVWPLRRRVIPRSALGTPRLVDRARFRQEYGFGVRIGAGGLWGGFGWLSTRQGTLSMWISRTDRFVLIPVAGDQTLMLTPADPEAFVAALGG